MQKKAKMYSGNTSGCSTNLCLTAMSTPRFVTSHKLLDVSRYSVDFVGLAGAIFFNQHHRNTKVCHGIID